jgi:hypothetical protein
MFCPKCGIEYREGFYECADCKVPLVWELTPEPEPSAERIEFVTVLETYDPSLIAVAKSFLQAAGFRCVVLGEGMRYVDPIKLQVESHRKEEARLLLSEMEEDFYAQR